MSKTINSNVSSMTLVDFANMVRMTSSGGFATSVEKTTGVIYADKTGKAHNVSARSLSKGDAASNRQLREQLVSAFGARHASVQFLAEVRKTLGLDPDVAGEDASKPLSQRTVKILLKTFNEGIVPAKNDKGQDRPTTWLQTRALNIGGTEAEGWVDVYDKTDGLTEKIVARLQTKYPDGSSRLKAVEKMYEALGETMPHGSLDLTKPADLKRLAGDVARRQMLQGPKGGLWDEDNEFHIDDVVRDSIGQFMFDELMASSPKAGEEKRMVDDLMQLLRRHAPGSTKDRLETAVSDVLLKNPLLRIGKDTYSRFGHTVRTEALRQFKNAMKNLGDEDKIAYLKDYKTHAREAAEKVERVLAGVKEKISDFLKTPQAEEMLHVVGSDGRPADDRSVNVRRKAAAEMLLHAAFTEVSDAGGPDLDFDECMRAADDYFRTTDGKVSANVDDCLARINYHADVVLLAGTKIKEAHGFDISDDVCEALARSAEEANLRSSEDNKAKPEKIGKHAERFADMFGFLMDACNQDKVKASNLFVKVLTMNANKPFSVTSSMSMLESIKETDLELPEAVTPESLSKFCRGLVDKTFPSAQKCLTNHRGELAADVLRDLYDTFALMLFSTRTDAREWLARQDEKDLVESYCTLQCTTNEDAQAVGDDAENVVNMNMSRIAEAMLFLKQADE